MTDLVNNSGRKLTLREQQADSDWRNATPTYQAGDVPVSEIPGGIDGSVFGFGIGDRSPDDPVVCEHIQAFVADHDVVGVRYLRAIPIGAQPS